MTRKIIFVFVIIYSLLGSNLVLAQGQDVVDDRRCGRGLLCGTIEAIAGDYYDAEADELKSLDTRYKIRLDDGRKLDLVGEIKELANAVDKRVAIQGKMRGKELYVEKHNFETPVAELRDFSPGQIELNSANPPANVGPTNVNFGVLPGPTSGNRKVAIQFVRVENIGSPTFDINYEQMNYAAFAKQESTSDPAVFSAHDFYKKSSFGIFGLEGTVMQNVITVTGTFSTPEECTQMIVEGWPNQVKAQNANNPVWEAADTKIVYFSTIANCGSQAWGSVGVKGSNGTPKYAEIHTPKASFETMTEYLKRLTATISHEIGHNLGIGQHSGGLNPDGTISDSGDRGCFMAGKFRFPNIYNRLAMGWFQGRMVAISGPRRNSQGQVIAYTFNLSPPDMPFRGLLNARNAIVVQLHNLDGTISDKIAVIEVRRIYKYDAFAIGNAYVMGVSVRIANADMTLMTAKPLMIDSTPGSIFAFDDAPLLEGQTLDLTQQFGFSVNHELFSSGVPGSRVSILVSR